MDILGGDILGGGNSEYDPKVDYLDQPCRAVANMIENVGHEDDVRNATIHVWIAMTDVIDYMAKGGSVNFAVKEPCKALNTYFMQCLQRLHDAGRGKNPVIINVNANGEFLNCNDPARYRRITRDIVHELRSERVHGVVGWAVVEGNASVP